MGEKIEKGKKKVRKNFFLAIAFLIVIIYFSFGLKEFLIKDMIKTQQVNNGPIWQTEKVDVLVFWQGITLVDAKGTNVLVSEGQRVPVGYEIMKSGSELVSTPKAGIVSFSRLINIFAEGTELDPRQLLDFYERNIENESTIINVLDNLVNPYLLIRLDMDKVSRNFQIGDKIWIEFAGDMQRKAEISEMMASGTEFYVLAEVLETHKLEKYCSQVEVNLIPYIYKGIEVVKETLVFKGEQPGVYLNQAGKIIWQQVKIEEITDKGYIVTSLADGEVYIVNASLVEEGEKIY